MKFKLKEKISQHLDYTADTPNNASSSMMRLLADALDELKEKQAEAVCQR